MTKMQQIHITQYRNEHFQVTYKFKVVLTDIHDISLYYNNFTNYGFFVSLHSNMDKIIFYCNALSFLPKQNYCKCKWLSTMIIEMLLHKVYIYIEITICTFLGSVMINLESRIFIYNLMCILLDKESTLTTDITCF